MTATELLAKYDTEDGEGHDKGTTEHLGKLIAKLVFAAEPSELDAVRPLEFIDAYNNAHGVQWTVEEAQRATVNAMVAE